MCSARALAIAAWRMDADRIRRQVELAERLTVVAADRDDDPRAQAADGIW